MTWSELVRRVAERTGRPRDEVKETLDALADTILEDVAAGEEVPIRGVCLIGSRWQDAHALRSIADRRRLVLDGRWVPRLRSSAPLRQVLLARSPQRWRDPRHQAAWRLAEALIGDLDLYHKSRAPRLDEDTPLPMVASICAVAFSGLWERVIETWNAQVSPEIRGEGEHLLRVARARWVARDE